jgi:hypothetical protein
VFMFSLSAVITAVTTWITPARQESKSIRISVPRQKGSCRATGRPRWEEEGQFG